ncbi:MAG: riboflavin synthase [Candidatus Marinimicrobia bacterium]|nr:riboflavin synthase [Candidatus Neomarinimicrobiota bacterium]MBL7023644.1 riboflavin synthase [Candidatus Neomarinimicrobiota bacterium]MBL7109796.1 riboflavin synthase [Candidatus Neomarinimicrobiota bacterium]
MFTGIIEELGQVKKISETSSGKQFKISAKYVTEDLKIGDSIAVNGVCLTVVDISKRSFLLDLVYETLKRSNLGDLVEGSKINLERALKLSDRLGGHILQGHVETVGLIVDKQAVGDGAELTISISPEWMRYCIHKGSIALDGVSMTIASISRNLITVAVIPHTLEETTLGIKEKGDTFNIETDIIGKHIERLMSFDEEDLEEGESYTESIMNWGFGES